MYTILIFAFAVDFEINEKYLAFPLGHCKIEIVMEDGFNVHEALPRWRQACLPISKADPGQSFLAIDMHRSKKDSAFVSVFASVLVKIAPYVSREKKSNVHGKNILSSIISLLVERVGCPIVEYRECFFEKRVDCPKEKEGERGCWYAMINGLRPKGRSKRELEESKIRKEVARRERIRDEKQKVEKKIIK